MGEELVTTGDVHFWLPICDEGKRRLRQVARYLAAHYPTPFPVRLRFERIAPKHSCVGETYRYAGPLVIRIDPRACFSWALETLIHEWAHAATWPGNARHEAAQVRAQHPEHPPEWNAVHGAMLTRVYDEGGLEDSEAW